MLFKISGGFAVEFPLDGNTARMSAMRPAKLGTIIGAIALLVLAIGGGCATGPGRQTAWFKRNIDNLFAEWNKPDSPGCALAVVKDGKVIYERGYGCANLEYGTPITPSAVFNIASVTKQFRPWQLSTSGNLKSLYRACKREQNFGLEPVFQRELNRFWQRGHVRCQKRNFIYLLRVIIISKTR